MTRARVSRFRGAALLPVALVAGLLAGCIDESAMVFSPDGKTLAFVTADPYHTPDGGFVIGPQAFRLMLLDEQRKIRVLETSTERMLSAPAFSPDGKRLAYLRVPLPTWQAAKQYKEDFDRRANALKDLANPAWVAWATGQQEAAASQPTASQPTASQPAASQPAASQPAALQPAALQIVDRALPPLKSTYVATALMMITPNVTATLVVRDVGSGDVQVAVPVELLDAGPDSMYVNTRLEFDQGGNEVYFTAGGLLMAVDLDGGKRVLGAGGSAQRLSPDGKMLAATIDDALSLVSTDGEMAIYRRLPASPVEGPAWVDAQTVAVLQDKPKPQSAATQSAGAATQAAATQEVVPWALVIQRVRRDGTLLAPMEIAMPAETPAGTMNQFVVAPDGKHVVVTMNAGVAFGVLGGTESRFQKGENLQQPVFSPDSRRVALKVLKEAEDKTTRTAAIAVFSADGKELYQVSVPAVAPGTTRPASQPAGG